MRILGIDYGKRKVGLAVSEGISASPLKVLEIHSLKDALVKISQIIKNEDIDKVVVGVPESGESLNLVLKFIDELKKTIHVETVDETLSSRNASTLMIDLGVSKKKRRQDDAYAAALLLENYLNG